MGVCVHGSEVKSGRGAACWRILGFVNNSVVMSGMDECVHFTMPAGDGLCVHVCSCVCVYLQSVKLILMKVWAAAAVCISFFVKSNSN